MADIVRVADVKEELMDYYLHGEGRGADTHFEILNKHWRPLPTDVTIIAGISNAGKSSWIEQMLLVRSVKDGKKHTFFSPEASSPVNFYANLAHALVGKPAENFLKNQMSEQEFKDALNFISKHFLYIYPDSDEPTPDYILSIFEKTIKDFGSNDLTIDPYSHLTTNIMEDGGRQDIHVSNFLKKMKRFALKHATGIFIVVHPNSSVERDKQGEFKLLQANDLRGGNAWINSSDCVLVYHRPFFISNFSDPLCAIYSMKIKRQKIQGMRGITYFIFDYKSGRFREISDENDYSDLSEIPRVGGFSPLDPKVEVVEQEIIPF